MLFETTSRMGLRPSLNRCRNLVARSEARIDGLRATENVDTLSLGISSTENVEMTPAQCRAARALLDWTQPKLAEAAGLGLSTIVDFERNRRAVSADALAAMRRALEGAGVAFASGVYLGVRIKARQSRSEDDANDNRTPLRPTGGGTPKRSDD